MVIQIHAQVKVFSRAKLVKVDKQIYEMCRSLE
jgi:hypothetical protein